MTSRCRRLLGYLVLTDASSAMGDEIPASSTQIDMEIPQAAPNPEVSVIALSLF